jgi:exonuclease 3'-5' domain-containing protein 1
MVHVVKSADSDAGGLFIAAVDRVCISEDAEPERVAFDCEGVNLSRLGSVELISVCFSSMEVFLVDVGGTPDPDIIKAVKKLFEDAKVTKIIHDCRMDSDALFHFHDIKLNNVHDTSCFHAEITGSEDENLNNVLMHNGVEQNHTRDTNVYKANPAFWASRPLTQKMIDWASSDVDHLFELAMKQLDCISSEVREARAVRESNEFVKFARDMDVESGLKVNNLGMFIGRGGANLRSLQKRTGTLIYSMRPENSWFVYYRNSDDLDTVKRSMRGW